jgi:Pectate lyase superfamily protein
MTSAIDATKPVDAIPAVKTDLRANLAAAKSEIEALQAKSIGVKDFGAVGNGSTDDTAAIQAAFTSAVTNRHGVYIPAGKYKITDTLWLTTQGSTFQTIRVFGDGMGYSPATGGPYTTWLDGSTITTKPVLATYRHRTVLLQDFAVTGPNDILQTAGVGSYRYYAVTCTATAGSATTATLPAANRLGTNFYVGWTLQVTSGSGSGRCVRITAYDNSTGIATFATGTALSATSVLRLQPWVAPASTTTLVRDSQHSPQCGLAIDVGMGTTPGDPYPGITYQGTVGGSHGTYLTRMAFGNHVVAIMVSPDGATANADTAIIQDCEITNCKVGVAVGQSQARNWTISGGNWSYLRTVIDGNNYGSQQGCAPAISGGRPAIGPAFELANINVGFGQLVCNNVYIESTHRLGYLTQGSASTQAAFSNSAIHLVANSTYGFGPGPLLLGYDLVSFRNCELLYDGSGHNSFAPISSAGSGSLSYDNCTFLVKDQFAPCWDDYTQNIPIAMRNCKIVEQAGGNVTLIGLPEHKALPARLLIAPGQHTVSSPTVVYKVTPPGKRPVSIAFDTFATGASTVTFHTSDVFAFAVGDTLNGRIVMPRADGNGTIIVRAPMLRVTSIVTGTGVVTCSWIVDKDYFDLDASQDTITVASMPWAAPATFVGNTNTSTSITGVTAADSTVAVGDFILAANGHIPANTRVTAVTATTITLSKAATGTATGTRLHWYKLDAL